MAHIKGRRDADLHHSNGTHRMTPPETSLVDPSSTRTAVSGIDVARHEKRIKRHLDLHHAVTASQFPVARASFERWQARRAAADRVLKFLEVHAENKPGEEELGCSFERAALLVSDLRTLAESV